MLLLINSLSVPVLSATADEALQRYTYHRACSEVEGESEGDSVPCESRCLKCGGT